MTEAFFEPGVMASMGVMEEASLSALPYDLLLKVAYRLDGRALARLTEGTSLALSGSFVDTDLSALWSRVSHGT